MNKKYRDIINAEKSLTDILKEELNLSVKTMETFLKDPENIDEVGEPIPEFDAILQEHVLLLRDLVRRCVAHGHTLENCGPSVNGGIEVLLNNEISKVPLDSVLLADYNFFNLSAQSKKGDAEMSIFQLLPYKKADLDPSKATITDFLPYWNMSLRGKWEKRKEYMRGDLLYIHVGDTNNNNQRYWFVAVKNLPPYSHKKPHPVKLEVSQWNNVDSMKIEADGCLYNLDYDLTDQICRYFSLKFIEFTNFASEVCKFIVLKDVDDFDDYHENIKTLHTSIFATFLMTSALMSFCSKDIEQSPVATLYIQNCINWLRKTCTSFESFHEPLVNKVERLITYWPVPLPDQKRVELIFLHGEGETKGFFTQTTYYKKRSGTTSISMTHPIQSILMYASCLYNFKFNLFDFNSKFKICFFDQHNDPLVIDTISTSTNITLSIAIGKLESTTNIQIVARCIDPSIKLRPCVPIQCSIENKLIDGMVVMIPVGLNLQQARQLIIDYAFAFESSTMEVYNQGKILEAKIALKELLECGEWLYVENGDRMEIEDEHLKSAIGYAVEQGSLEMKDGEQTTNLIFAFAPIDSSFFTESFFNTIQSL